MRVRITFQKFHRLRRTYDLKRSYSPRTRIEPRPPRVFSTHPLCARETVRFAVNNVTPKMEILALAPDGIVSHTLEYCSLSTARPPATDLRTSFVLREFWRSLLLLLLLVSFSVSRRNGPRCRQEVILVDSLPMFKLKSALTFQAQMCQVWYPLL